MCCVPVLPLCIYTMLAIRSKVTTRHVSVQVRVPVYLRTTVLFNDSTMSVATLIRRLGSGPIVTLGMELIS